MEQQSIRKVYQVLKAQLRMSLVPLMVFVHRNRKSNKFLAGKVIVLKLLPLCPTFTEYALSVARLQEEWQ